MDQIDINLGNKYWAMDESLQKDLFVFFLKSNEITMLLVQCFKYKQAQRGRRWQRAYRLYSLFIISLNY